VPFKSTGSGRLSQFGMRERPQTEIKANKKNKKTRHGTHHVRTEWVGCQVGASPNFHDIRSLFPPPILSTKENKKETQSNCYQTYYTYRKTVDARGGGMITYGLVLCFLSRSKRSRNPIRIQSDSTFVCVSVSFFLFFLFFYRSSIHHWLVFRFHRG
jgi:hypothetical protein